jgi:hypothetical protein
MRKGLLSSAGRGVALATIAVLVVTMSEPPLAMAASASKGVSVTTASGDATDFSSARRRRYWVYRSMAERQKGNERSNSCTED